MTTLLTLVFEVPAPHTLAKPDLSDEEIKKYFSDCGKRHGHNYFLEISFDRTPGKLSNTTQISIRDLKNSAQLFLQKFMLGKDLNEIYDNTSGEALAAQILKQIRSTLWGKAALRLAIRETKKNSFISESNDLKSRFV